VKDVEKPIELQRLYVDDRFHGSGVGGALFRHVEVLAKERGFKTSKYFQGEKYSFQFFRQFLRMSDWKIKVWNTFCSQKT